MTVNQYIRKYQKLIIALILLIVPILGTIYLTYVGKTYDGTDIAFHWQRMIELHYDLVHGILPQFMTHAESPLGSAINIFYPYEALLPFISLTFIFRNPLHLIYAVYTSIWIAISVISYFSSKTYFKSKKTSLLFSILYTACSTIGNAMLLNGDFGQALSYAVLPLILFGFLNLIQSNGNHWLMLCMGVSLVIFSHILTTVLMIVALIMWSVFNIKNIFTHIKILLALIKAGILTCLITAIMWLPMIYTIEKNNYYNPKYGSHVAFWMSGLLWCRSGAFIHENCGFMDGIGIIVGLVALLYLLIPDHIYGSWAHMKFSKYDWQIWTIGMFFWLCNTNLWIIHHICATTALNVFQFSFRTALPLHLFFTFIAVKWLSGYYSDTPIEGNKRSYYKRIIIAGAVFLAIIMQIGNQLNDKLIYQQRAIYRSSRACNFGAQQMKLTAHHPQGRGFTLDANSYRHMLNTKILQDYQPMNTVPGNSQPYDNLNYYKALINVHQHQSIDRAHLIPVKLTENGVRIHLSHDVKNIVIPLIFYNGFSYYVTNYRKSIRWTKNDKANFVEIHHLKSGNYLFQIHPKFSNISKKSLTITYIGLIILISCLLKYSIIKKLRAIKLKKADHY